MLIANSSGIEYIYHGHTLSTVYSSPLVDNKLKINFAEALLTKHPPPAKHHPFTLRSLQATQWFQSCPCRGTIFHGYRIVPAGPPCHVVDLIDGRIQAQVWKLLEEMINPSKSSHSSLRTPGDYPRNPGSSKTLKIPSVEALSITVHQVVVVVSHCLVGGFVQGILLRVKDWKYPNLTS